MSIFKKKKKEKKINILNERIAKLFAVIERELILKRTKETSKPMKQRYFYSKSSIKRKILIDMPYYLL